MLGKGKAIIQGNKALNHVLYVPSTTRSLVFVGKLVDSGHIITFDSKSYSIVHASTPQLLAYFGIHYPKNGLYSLWPRVIYCFALYPPKSTILLSLQISTTFGTDGLDTLTFNTFVIWPPTIWSKVFLHYLPTQALPARRAYLPNIIGLKFLESHCQLLLNH